jgi:pilus assembly protein CpaC
VWTSAVWLTALGVTLPAVAQQPPKPVPVVQPSPKLTGTRIVPPLVVQAGHMTSELQTPPVGSSSTTNPTVPPPGTGQTPPGTSGQTPPVLGEPPRFPNLDNRVPQVQPNPQAGAANQARPPQDPFAPRSRLSALDAPIGTTPKPDAQTLEKYRTYVDSIQDPDNTLDLVVGRPRILQLKQAPVKIQAVDPNVADIEPIRESNNRAFFLLGKQPGTTVIALFFADPAAPDRFRILNYLVRVVPDPEAKTRLERVYQALEGEINRAFPNSIVKLCLVGDKLVVAGQAKDVAEAAKILQIVREQAPQTTPPQRIPVDRIDVTVTPDPLNPDQTIPQGLQNFVLSGATNVVNLLRVPGEHQVMLRVTVAEVNRAALRSIGMNFNIFDNEGRRVFGQTTGSISAAANLPALLDNGQIALAINALRNLNFARTLAEPSLVTLSGQAATFQAGGQFPVPVVTGFTANGLQGVSFVPFGVQLSFTPIVTDKDRIRLTINAEVSALNQQQATNIAGANVPGLNTRRFTNVVELREGQTLAVAGLIQNNHSAQADRVPLFGDLPGIGRAFGFDRTTSGEQEVVFLITPELVHPMEHTEVPPLPGYNVFEPGDTEFYLYNRLESRRTEDYRAGVRTDIHRMWNYHQCQDQYISGPFGPSAVDVKVPAGPNNVVLPPGTQTLPPPKAVGPYTTPPAGAPPIVPGTPPAQPMPPPNPPR